MEAIGELDQDDPDVRGHRDHHLAVVLGLSLVAALEGDPGQLRDAVDEPRDHIAKLGADVFEVGARVLDRVMQQRRADRLGVETQPRAGLRDLERVVDEPLARAAALVDVALTGEREGALDRLPVELLATLGRMLLDHRQQIAEQAPVGRAQRSGVLVERRRAAATGFDLADVGVLVERRYRGCFLLSRNRVPSWWRSRYAL